MQSHRKSVFIWPLIRRMIPSKLKYRFFFASILFVLIPLAVTQYNQFKKIEELIETKVSQLNDNQLEHMVSTLDEFKKKIMMAMLIIENDPEIKSKLKNPFDSEELERFNVIDSRFKKIQKYVNSQYVEVALADLHGNQYFSYQFDTGEQQAAIIPEAGYDALLNGNEGYYLFLDKSGSRDLWGNAPFFTLFSIVKDNDRKPIGMLRIQVDYQEWFNSAAKDLSYGQAYLIVNANGQVIAQTKNGMQTNAGLINQLIADHKNQNSISYRLNNQTNTLMNIRYAPSLDWYVINQFPLDLFLGDLTVMRQQVLVTLYIVIAVFSIVTFLISASITRPLQQLQNRMKIIAKKNLKIQAPEHELHGEIQNLNQSFNKMVQDISELVEQLKMEERQKEAIYSRMLMLQINPHFLLNTLNSIKWIALEQNNDRITQVCISLGKLLETSLNTEIELISLKEELNLLKAYLYIQKYRYDMLFEVIYDTERASEYALVPKLSLQPLVENAIHHGLSHMESGGLILITIYPDNNKLKIEVDDNGRGPSVSQLPGTRNRGSRGIGLSNLRERYRLLFKEDSEVQLLSLSPGTRVRITLPLLVSEPYHALEVKHDVENTNR
ncbi:sensor histidine kinase [Paenibacillus sp. PAMC21692]|uniref:sensor histidine kinase n=1 Tax=Paenibacillus sp. PAMC21692 TaxID=2762320 RepID=UPI00164E0AE7|nr:sensor histidine kinase [Paenibacillus sp. PAMC21692]QNK60221.1 histidine kinase [Paenibacillus sp. PAMC21692]